MLSKTPERRYIYMAFIKQHKFLFAIFTVCILLMIKNSSIPYLFCPHLFIAFIFDKPQNDFLSGIAQMIDIFSSAYVTSLLFYYMVDFLPAAKQEVKAKEIIAPKLISLYLYISELLAMIEYSAKQENIFQTANPDVMDKLNIQNKPVLCKQKTFKNEQECGNPAYYSYNLLKDCDKYKTLILNTCREISSAPSFSYCDKQIIDIISKIQLSGLFHILPEPTDFFVKFNFVATQCLGLGKEYSNLVLIQKELATFVETRYAYEFVDISNDEIKRWNEEQAEAFRKHPELAQLLTEFQQTQGK